MRRCWHEPGPEIRLRFLRPTRFRSRLWLRLGFCLSLRLQFRPPVPRSSPDVPGSGPKPLGSQPPTMWLHLQCAQALGSNPASTPAVPASLRGRTLS